MKIGVIGGAGKAGRAIYNEALRRGDQPTAIVRDLSKAEGVLGEFGVFHVRDARQLTAADIEPYDVVVDALGTDPAHASAHVEVAKRLVDLVRGRQRPRLVFILGAASLTKGGRPYLDELYEQDGTASWIAVPEQQARELRFLQGVTDIDWVGVSPSADFVPGPARTPLLGDDELLVDADGVSRVTTGTLAVAVLDEIHEPRHTRARFTVRDA